MVGRCSVSELYPNLPPLALKLVQTTHETAGKQLSPPTKYSINRLNVFILFYFTFYMSECFTRMDISIPCVCLVPGRPEEDVRFSGTGIVSYHVGAENEILVLL